VRQLAKSFSKGRRPYRGHLTARFQRSTVKISYAKNLRTKSWAAHGSYLARHGAARNGEKGLGFDHERDDIPLYATLHRWQQVGDPHVFKVMVSPERGAELDLVGHSRGLVARMERDLRTRLEWAGIVHINTGKPHAHLVIRGVDERGETLTLAKDYISNGIRELSRELATRELGYRTRREIESAREAAIERQALTEIDRAILSRADPERRVSYERAWRPGSQPHLRDLQEIRRLNFLERMGLARDVGVREWILSEHTARVLKEADRVSDIARTLANSRVLLSNPNAQIVFTRIEREGQRLVGRLVGTEVEPGREGGRYLLLEGTDGLVHFVRLPRERGWARDEARLVLDSIVTLTGRRVSTRSRAEGGADRESIVYPAIQVEWRWPDLVAGRTPLAVDLEIIERVERKARLPRPVMQERGFAKKWSDRVKLRAKELERGRVIEREEAGRFILTENWRERLDQLRKLGRERER
jgi:type IV secretory pathway VirD2 relaxase